MSLFATDAALLADVPRTTSATPRDPAARHAAATVTPPSTTATPVQRAAVAAPPIDAPALAERWSQLLPTLVGSALRHGFVRTAAMLHESALERTTISPAAIETSRQQIDACAALDASLQQRQLQGEVAFVPSLSISAAGTPSFMTGLCWDELAHPVVAEYVADELCDGAQAELRNFLDETLRDGALFVDLEPGVGTALSTALTWNRGSVTVRAWQPDAVLHALIARNATHTGVAARLDLRAHAATPQELQTRTPPAHSVVHLGTQSATPFRTVLKAWSSRAVAIAWRTDAHDADAQASTLDALGYTSFVIAVRDGETELVPHGAAAGGSMAFALSHAFIAALEQAR